MNNKILIVVDKKIKEFSEDLTLKAPCFQLLEKEELLLVIPEKIDNKLVIRTEKMDKKL